MIEQQLSALITAIRENTLVLKAHIEATTGSVMIGETPAVETPDPKASATKPAPATTPPPAATTAAPTPKTTEATVVVPESGEVLTALRATMAAVQAAKPDQGQDETKATVMGVLVASSGGARNPGDVKAEDRAAVIAALANLAANPVA